MDITIEGSPKERSISPSERRKLIEDTMDEPHGKKQKVIEESDRIAV